MKSSSVRTDESPEESALQAVMSEARQEAVARRQAALAVHYSRLIEAVRVGVSRRQELVREY